MKPPRYQGSGPGKEFGIQVRARVHAHFKAAGISQKADLRLWPKVAFMVALFLLPWVAVLTIPMPAYAALLLAVLMGVGMAGIGMSVMHDALHGSSSRHRWVNDLLGNSMYLLGSDVFTWKVQHNGAHHIHTNVDPVDQDIDPPDLLRFSQHAPLWRVHRWQHVYAFFFYGLLTVVKLGNDFFSLAKASRDPQHRDYNFPLAFGVMALVKCAHIFAFIVLPLWLTPFSWWQVLLGFFAMHFTASVIMGVVFQLAHVVEGAHQPLPDGDGLIATDWTVHELLTTANFAPRNRFVTWFTGGLNFQVEHHLFPYISHLHYPAIAPIVQRTAQEYGLPYNVKHSTRAAVWSHVRRLHHLGHHQ